MRDPFANYDAWLEKPYQDMMDDADAYYDWCDLNGVDPDSEEAEIGYQEWMEVQYEDYPDDYDDYDEEEADYYYDPLPE